MFRFFNRQRQPEETAFEEYKRLVELGDESNFLDIDTTLVISDREEINNQIVKGGSDIDKGELERLDKMFKDKIRADLAATTERIESGDANKEYLIGVLRDVSSFGEDEPHEKWWFHLLDESKWK